jgi:hypothetical protein
MPNLRQSVLESFWNNKNQRLARILGWMESMEDWILDDQPTASSKIFELAAALERTTPDRLMDSSQDLAEALAYMSSPRSLRVIQWLDENFGQDACMSLVTHAANNQDIDSSAALMLDRFQRLNQINLLGHIFAPSRSRSILDLLASQPEVT